MYPHNLTRSETRARAELIDTHAYTIEVDLTGRAVHDPQAQFASTSAIAFTARTAGSLHVDLIADAVSAASLDGRPLSVDGYDGSRLVFNVEGGDHELVVSAVCRFSRSGEGLHRFVDPADHATYLYTQFESADARRMYACFEQPDLKARFGISVHAPQSWTVISNGIEQSRVVGPDDMATWTFAETERVSTYLTALVAGDYHRVDTAYAAVAGTLPMSVLCRRSLVEHLDAERIFAITRSGFDVFERAFDFAYPFGKYDQVFVPEYNSGAMENIGCVIIRDEYVFRSRVTPASYQVRDDTLLHELSHMWFGDLVTMRWWDDLWLKESFATWAANFAASELAENPSTAWASFTNGFKTWAFRQDQLPTTHPIAADMVDLEAVEQNFDGITYSKGASVLAQLVAYAGREEFLAGTRAYFARHAYGNTDLADLLAVLGEVSGRDLTEWAALWLQTTGVNTVRAEFDTRTDDSGVETFSSFAVEQSAPTSSPTLRPHRMAIGLYQLADGRLRRVGRVEIDIDGARTEIAELVGLRRPDLILLNDDDLTYAKVRLDPRSLHTVLHHLADLDDPLARAVCWAAMWDMCRDGELAAADYVGLVLRAVGAESDFTAVRSTLGQALSSARHYTPVPIRADVLTAWQAGIIDLLDAARPGSDHQLALAKALPGAAQDETGIARLSGWLAGEQVPEGVTIDPELRWSTVIALARLGQLDESSISAEEARDHTATGAEQATAARAARPTAEAKAEAWRLATAEPDISNSRQRAACLAFWQRGQSEVLEPYVESYLEVAADISANRNGWEDRGYAMRNNVLRLLFPVPVDLAPFLVRLDSWIAEHELSDSVRRTIAECRDDAQRSLRAQTSA